jgi:hypothetical protein
MQYESEKRDKLEKLERKLYSRNTVDLSEKKRQQFNSHSSKGNTQDVGETWQEDRTGKFDELAAKFSNMAQNKNNLAKKIFVISLVFFLIAAGGAIFVFLGGTNLVSSKNVDIKIVGPISIGGGQEVSLDINTINNNNVDLDSASLLVEYPDGVRSAADLTKELDQERYTLGKIKSGESYSQNIKAVFFGEKESIKEIKISLEYRVENSSALFYKEKIYEMTISSAPVIITSTYPKEVNSNQSLSFNIEVASNSKDTVENFLVNIQYPFGFTFKEATPAASYGNNVWRFDSLKAGDKKTISVKGTIVGQNEEERVFKINTGTASEKDERTIAVLFNQLVESLTIKKSFIGLGVSVGGKEGDLAVQGGDQVTTEVSVINNLPSKLYNISVEASFKGGAFNPLAVSPGGGGFFQSFNNTILWDKRSVPEFSDMEPGAIKVLYFNVTPFLYEKIIKGSKPEIEITVKSKGERVLDSGSVEEVSAAETRRIVLSSNVVLSSKTVRSIGNLENSGPIPPKADIPTTYTIVWSISNSLNQMGGVEVRAILPSYVKWTGLYSPTSELISFNQATKEVIWNVGSILPNTGFGTSKKEIYFQLEFMPSLSQLSQAPIILGGASLVGVDKVTGIKTEVRTAEITTNFSSDPTFKTGDDRVVQ